MITVLSALVLLGVLIAVHELGHFLVAKASGVKVELFSIGFGKALVKFRHGETEYRIAYFPFGGYVSMLGQDMSEERPEADRGRSLLDKPPLVRIAVYLAGPAMNLLLAYGILFPLFGLDGNFDQVPSSVVGAVDRGMPAGADGALRSGDELISLDDEPISAFWQISRRLESYSPKQGPIHLGVRRPDLSRPDAPPQLQVVELTPEPFTETHPMLGFQETSWRLGIVGEYPAADIAITSAELPLALAGFRTHDRVLRVAGRDIYRFLDLEAAFAQATPGSVVDVIVERTVPLIAEGTVFDWATRWPSTLAPGPQYFPRSPTLFNDERLPLHTRACLASPGAPGCEGPTYRFDAALTYRLARPVLWSYTHHAMRFVAPEDRSGVGLGFGHASSCVSFVDPQGAAALATAWKGEQPDGLQIGDCILSIDRAVHSTASFIGLKLNDAPDEPKIIEVSRQGQRLSFALRAQRLTTSDRLMGETQHWDVGMLINARPDRAVAPDAVQNPERWAFAWHETRREIPDRVKETVFSIGGLFSGKVSPQQLSGPLTIMYLAGKQAEKGLSDFLQLMVLISLGLAVFNLVPLPGLDGGQILFALIELVIRRRAPIAVYHAINRVGVAMIVVLLVFVLTNDGLRMLRLAG